jgi:hypothetical protein
MKIIFRSKYEGRKNLFLNFRLNKWQGEFYFYLLPTRYIKRISKQKSKNLFYVDFEWLFWRFEIEYRKYKKQ